MENLKGKTILVTGATGFIGQHLVRILEKIPDIKLIVLSRKPGSESKENIIRLAVSFDQLTKEIWREKGTGEIDIVFHLGAFTPKSREEANRLSEIYRDNIAGTQRLLDCLPNVPEKIIFSSTLDVYMPPAQNGVLTEESVVGPVSLYGASKLFGEEMVCVYAKKQGCGHAILRYGNIFGPGEEAYNKIIPQTIRRLLRGEPPVVYGDGSELRDFLYIDDVIEATLRAAASHNRALGPINIVRGKSYSILEIIKLLRGITGFKGSIQFLKNQPSGYSIRFDNSKMCKVLGEFHFVSLEEGLKKEVKIFRHD